MAEKNNLVVLLNGEQMGLLQQDARGRLAFSYTAGWLARDLPVPLSLSLPVLPVTWKGSPLENWLWGLLPDNEEILRRWAQQFQVSPRNVFALLAELGEDVAGAVQFVRPERVDEARTGGTIRWLAQEDFDARIAALATDAALARRADDPGRFSLAGAQAKSAFLYRDGRYGVPSGRFPTNCIVKPASTSYAGLIENEHFCLRLAAAFGLNAARTRVIHAQDTAAIVVDRYDRVERRGEFLRLHQEDMCQARGMHPSLRYQNEGGPGVRDILQVLNASSEPARDRAAFMQAQVFNFLVGGTDAHAKNFSILLGAGGAIRFAPLYDIASMFPYGDFQRMKLAMRIADRYDFETTLPRHWHALGQYAREIPSPVETLEDAARRIPALAEQVAGECEQEGLQHPVFAQLVERISTMCTNVLKDVELFRNMSS